MVFLTLSHSFQDFIIHRFDPYKNFVKAGFDHSSQDIFITRPGDVYTRFGEKGEWKVMRLLPCSNHRQELSDVRLVPDEVIVHNE